MVTLRSVLAGLCLVLAMLSAAGCVQVNEAVNGRDLECNGVPEDTCVRMADDIVRQWDPASLAQDGPIVKVRMQPTHCGDDPPMVHCWEVEAIHKGGGFGGIYAQGADGTLIGPGGKVIGN